MYRFEIDGETPAKKNSRITLRNGKTIPSKKYQEWHSSAYAQVFAQKVQQKITEPLNKRLKILVTFVHKDQRRRDSDNSLSSLLDLFQDVGILADDNWKIVRRIEIDNKEGDVSKAIVKIHYIQ